MLSGCHLDVSRAELAAQEAALEAAEQEQQDVQARVQAAGHRFAKVLARLEDDEAALARDRSEQVCLILLWLGFLFIRVHVF